MLTMMRILIQQAWNPDQPIELELRDWHSRGYNPASHLAQHACLQTKQISYSGIELRAYQLMEEHMELEVPAMLVYLSFLTSTISKRYRGQVTQI